MKGILVVSQAAGCQHTGLGGLGESILAVSLVVGCQHTGLGGLGERNLNGFLAGLGGLGERHLSGFPGCRLPTYRARRVG